jgi:hypothetical protein
MWLNTGGFRLEPRRILTARWLRLLLAFSAGSAAILLDVLVLRMSLLAEGPPAYTPFHLLRTALMAACSGLLVGTVRRSVSLPTPGAGTVATCQVSRSTPVRTFPNGVFWIVCVVSLLLLGLFLYDPYEFFVLGSEDHPVETLSAVMCFIASAACAVVAWTLLRETDAGMGVCSAACALSVGMFLIGMEEISWFQRILSYPTPFFLQNEQKEMNFHNFATGYFENLYYCGMFVLLIVAPFVADETRWLRRWKPAFFYVPSRGILYVAAWAFAYNYDMWNQLTTQLCFFVTLFILIQDARRAAHPAPRWALGFLTVAFAVTQGLFLIFGHRSVRVWDVTEYKEFLLPLAVVIYSLELVQQAKLCPRTFWDSGASSPS